jgi:hypothetical protein
LRQNRDNPRQGLFIGDLLELIIIGTFHAIVSVLDDNGEKSLWRKALKVIAVLVIALPLLALGLYMPVA